ncbi:MAG: DUF3754 domain-containing protein [Myxococcota bacterium]
MSKVLARRVPTPVSRMGVELPDDRYIPVRPDDLLSALIDDADRFGCTPDELQAVSEGLEGVVGQEIEALRRGLERAYDPHNPARDTLLVGDPEQLSERAAELRHLLAYVLDKANYERLDEVQMEAAVGAASSHGIRIRVNPDRLQWIDLWVRGRTTTHRAIRSLRRPIKGREHEIELYRRLAVVFQAQGEEDLNLKLFREIPVADVEALLPHAEVAMSPFDRFKVFGGSLGAMGGLLLRMFETTVAATQFMWLAVAALGGLSVRSILGYRRAKHVRLSQMTHHLYYQNVANGSGVLDRLIANIGHEELKESLLAYALIRGGEVHDESSLAETAAAWLAECFDVEVDFDAPDAVRTLERFGLWEDREGWSVRAPADAEAELTRAWRERRTQGHHLAAARER